MNCEMMNPRFHQAFRCPKEFNGEECGGKLEYHDFGYWQCQSCWRMTHDSELPEEPDYEESQKED